MSTSSGFKAKLWHEPLTALGFATVGEGQFYCRDDLAFSVQEGWGILQAEWRARLPDAVCGQLCQPGLWKLLQDRKDRTAASEQPVFELPPTLLSTADPRSQGAEGGQLFQDVLTWALNTRPEYNRERDTGGPNTRRGNITQGEDTAGWTSPARHEVELCLPDGSLTFRVGHILRQVSLVHESHRLALQCMILPHLPPALPAPRANWLGELLRQGHNRWRMVRIGKTPEEVVLAEVDLTGAPPLALEPLLGTGQEALRYAVEGLVRAADFLVEEAAVCRALEVHSPRALPAN